jgi:hypothetical protein
MSAISGTGNGGVFPGCAGAVTVSARVTELFTCPGRSGDFSLTAPEAARRLLRLVAATTRAFLPLAVAGLLPEIDRKASLLRLAVPWRCQAPDEVKVAAEGIEDLSEAPGLPSRIAMGSNPTTRPGPTVTSGVMGGKSGMDGRGLIGL